MRLKDITLWFFQNWEVKNLKILLHSYSWYMFFIDNFVNIEVIKNKINITGSLKCSDNPCWNQGTSSHYFLFLLCWSFSSVLQYFLLNIPVWAYYFPLIHRYHKLLDKILLKLILTFKILKSNLNLFLSRQCADMSQNL